MHILLNSRPGILDYIDPFGIRYWLRGKVNSIKVKYSWKDCDLWLFFHTFILSCHFYLSIFFYISISSFPIVVSYHLQLSYFISLPKNNSITFHLTIVGVRWLNLQIKRLFKISSDHIINNKKSLFNLLNNFLKKFIE